ncbi:MAG: adenylate/guanylate cyclase domain-containing protein, partial [Alphaproteobacteria bacterium]
MAARNAEVPEDRRIILRIGVNLGDIIIDGDDIHGDGVNLAARLQAESEAGWIAISDTVNGQIKNRLDASFRDDGEHSVKNIAQPVRIWRWVPDGYVAPTTTSAPDKPSIAVLPFDNNSGDQEQEYFSDGMTEDLTTALSRFDGLFVIARNSAFTYKGEAVDVTRVGRELGVRYVLEGSVRRSGNRVRINAQLIDAGADRHVWAERFDRQIDDVFELQDDIV